MAKKIINTSGNRKRAVARATLKDGKGMVRINKQIVDKFGTSMTRMKVREPLLLAADLAAKVDITVDVRGGGINSQADAARLAIAKALVEFSGKDKEKLKKQFLEYDRTLLVADVRRKEVCKPNISKARARRQKSYR
jgi:small subunit ribosomal protein S9